MEWEGGSRCVGGIHGANCVDSASEGAVCVDDCDCGNGTGSDDGASGVVGSAAFVDSFDCSAGSACSNCNHGESACWEATLSFFTSFACWGAFVLLPILHNIIN